MSRSLAFSNFSRNEKIFFIGLLIWIALQLSRFVAYPMITDIYAGSESAAWLFFNEGFHH